MSIAVHTEVDSSECLFAGLCYNMMFRWRLVWIVFLHTVWPKEPLWSSVHLNLKEGELAIWFWL